MNRIKIISGGQTGADRAALDFALAHGLAQGGWCPAGRLAEDGCLDARYRLEETPLSEYVQRTEWNVRDADGTVIFSLKPELTGGSLITQWFAEQHGRPCLHLHPGLGGEVELAGRLEGFVKENRVAVLNVAGPRASTEPAIGRFVTRTLELAFR